MIDPNHLRRAMGCFATGVTVVTTVDTRGTPFGFTANAVCSLSLEPPLVLVCVGRERAAHTALAQRQGFALSILAEHQVDVALRFARPSMDRFADLQVRPGRHGIPLIDGSIAGVECALHTILEGGDHSIFVGHVNDAWCIPGAPLIFWGGSFLQLGVEDLQRAELRPPEWLVSAPW